MSSEDNRTNSKKDDQSSPGHRHNPQQRSQQRQQRFQQAGLNPASVPFNPTAQFQPASISGSVGFGNQQYSTQPSPEDIADQMRYLQVGQQQPPQQAFQQQRQYAQQQRFQQPQQQPSQPSQRSFNQSRIPPPIATGRPAAQDGFSYGFSSSLYSNQSGSQSAYPFSAYGVSQPSAPNSATALEGVHHIWKPQGAGRPQFPPQDSSIRQPMSALEPATSGSYGLFSGLNVPFNSSLTPVEEPSLVSPRFGAPGGRWTVGRSTPTSATQSITSGTIQQSGSASSTGSKEGITFPNRPDMGSKGKQIRVRANFFEFLTFPGQTIYQYDVKITPEVPPSLNRKIFKELIIQYGKEQLGGTMAVFDGRRSLYTPKAIPIEGGVFEIDVYISDEVTPSKDTSKPKDLKESESAGSSSSSIVHSRKFTVRLKSSSVIEMNQIQDFISGKVTWAPLEALQALDVLMRHRPSMMLTSVGRSFFTRNESKLLGDGAECWMGFHQSVRPAKGKLLMNIDVSATAFFEPSPVLQFIARNLNKKSPEDMKAPLKSREIEKIERLLKSVKLVVNHRGDIKRKYKIVGFTRTSADQTFFKYTPSTRTPSGEVKVEGPEEEISVAEYFKRQYNLQLKFPHLPCARVGNQLRSVYLPLEVCDIASGQRFLRKLNESQTAQMIRLTCQTPDKRANKIAQAISELGLDKIGEVPLPKEEPSLHPDDATYLSSFGVKLKEEMMVIPARVLDPPTIQYHPTSREPLITPREGSWNLRDKKVVQPATLHSWAVVCFGTPRDMPQHKIDHFLRELINTCRDTGLTITNPHPPAVYGDPQTNIEQTMQVAWQAAGESTQSFPQLILCVLPNTGVPLYSEIKRVGDTVLGVPTQCVQVKHTFQPKKQYCANVCLKINAKLGGVNSFIVKNPSVSGDEGLPWVSEVPTIIFGADITHPSHGETRAAGSVCALVGSLDRLASRYSATVRLQPPRREVILDLTSMVQELLKIFYLENNQIAPQRILFYRDGVSESQFHEVVQIELKAIKQACERLQAGYSPTITYVVVQKRHHARVFATNPKDADRSGNIPAGTVIDSHITHPCEYDFYLCSHAGLQGTSRPTHYHVLHDENGFTPDMLHELTNRLCYGYARCTRSVSVVPPAYYADLVAFRAKYHMKSQQIQSQGSSREESVPDTPIDDESMRSRRKKNVMTKEEEEEMMKKLQTRLAPVKPELQKVMYFM